MRRSRSQPKTSNGVPRSRFMRPEHAEREPVRPAQRQLLLEAHPAQDRRVQVVLDRVRPLDPELAGDVVVVDPEVEAGHLVLVLVGEELEPRLGHRLGQLPAVGGVVDSGRLLHEVEEPLGEPTVLVVEDLGRPSPKEVAELGRDGPPWRPRPRPRPGRRAEGSKGWRVPPGPPRWRVLEPVGDARPVVHRPAAPFERLAGVGRAVPDARWRRRWRRGAAAARPAGRRPRGGRRSRGGDWRTPPRRCACESTKTTRPSPTRSVIACSSTESSGATRSDCIMAVVGVMPLSTTAIVRPGCTRSRCRAPAAWRMSPDR